MDSTFTQSLASLTLPVTGPIFDRMVTASTTGDPDEMKLHARKADVELPPTACPYQRPRYARPLSALVVTISTPREHLAGELGMALHIFGTN